MKVLLCSPYNINEKVTQGGISIWAQNIDYYYKSINTNIELNIIPYDRKFRKKSGRLMRLFSGIVDYYSAIKITSKKLNSEQFDVLHLCTSASISLAKDLIVIKMAKKKGLKTVIHFHFGRIPDLLQKQNWEYKLVCKVLNMVDKAIIIDMKTYNALKNKGYTNVYYLPNPLSVEIINTIKKEEEKITRDKKKISFVGHVIPSKGVYELVEACKNLHDIKLYVIGKVSDEVRFRMEQIAGKNLSVEFKGEINHHSVIIELLSSYIFVLPTYTEGFPNVIVESMACGCAIATTSVGAIPEMLNINSNNPCGICCEPKDVNTLRNIIQYYIDHPNETVQYTKRAKKRVNELYAIPIIWEQLVKIWNEN